MQIDIGYKPSSMHMHVVFDLPKVWLSKNPSENAWRIFDFWRRLNLTMEMRDVFENGLSLIRNYSEYKDKRYTNFSTASTQAHDAVLNYLISVGKSFNTKVDLINIQDQAKIGWVGFWGHDKYDKTDLFGFEFRFLEGADLPSNLVKYLNQIPDQIYNQDFGMEPETLRDWSETLFTLHARELTPPDYFKKYFSNQIYFPENNDGIVDLAINPHRSYDSLLSHRDFEFQRILLGQNYIFNSTAFNSRGRLRYLLHDWSLDPLLFNKPVLAHNIRNAQLSALRKWTCGEDEKAIIQKFLLESGLYELFAESIGFKL